MQERRTDSTELTMEPGKICCMFNDLKSFMAFISLANNAGYFFVRDLKLFNGYIPCNRQAYLFVPRMVVNDEMLVRGIGEHAGGSLHHLMVG